MSHSPNEMAAPSRRRLGRTTRILTMSAGVVAAFVLVVILMNLQSWRRLYFVPLEADPELLQSLKAYYQEELGLDIGILPSVQLTAATWNEDRQQVEAEQVIKLIYERYPQLRWPKPAIVIGITSRDLYIKDRPWQFAFSWREGNRAAVVSYQRMDPRRFGRPSHHQLLETRLRKMVTRNIGIMGFGLGLTPDRHDLMYQDVLGLQELDDLIEDLGRAGFPVLPKHSQPEQSRQAALLN